jgi:hypothetical protein
VKFDLEKEVRKEVQRLTTNRGPVQNGCQAVSFHQPTGAEIAASMFSVATKYAEHMLALTTKIKVAQQPRRGKK